MYLNASLLKNSVNFPDISYIRSPTTTPVVVITALVATERPTTPADCPRATMLPAATPPPLAMAAADIIFAASDPAAMPAAVNPTALSTNGAPMTAVPSPMATPVSNPMVAENAPGTL
uniref:Uncharacterized protein n=1 Tax=Micrurus paraensis TaxID=1970185 RepID=A0A2D4KU02_9SAUR